MQLFWAAKKAISAPGSWHGFLRKTNFADFENKRTALSNKVLRSNLIQKRLYTFPDRSD